MPNARTDASLTTAKAGANRSSRLVPSSICLRNSLVLAFNLASLKAAVSFSRALISSTLGKSVLILRSLEDPKNLRATPENIPIRVPLEKYI